MEDIHKIFESLRQALLDDPEDIDSLLQEAEDKVIGTIQNKNACIFEDLLSTMKSIPMETKMGGEGRGGGR